MALVHPFLFTTVIPEEKAVMGQHMAYTRQLFDQGKIVLCGAATDGAIGIIVWRVDSGTGYGRWSGG
jgi:hypothetical protein